MKRLYLTHEPGELCAAWVLLNLSLGVGWAVLTSPFAPAFFVWVVLQTCAAGLVMVGFLLFGMSGSRKRREAAEKAANEKES